MNMIFCCFWGYSLLGWNELLPSAFLLSWLPSYTVEPREYQILQFFC